MDYDKLREVIENNSLGITGLFKKLDISRGSFYYSIENKTLKVETLEKICQILEINILQFFPIYDAQTIKSNDNYGGLEIIDDAIINYKEKYLRTLEKLNDANERLLSFTDPKKDITKKV